METPPFLSDTPSRQQSRDKRVGREISFGIQQTLACWATDFIDPVVGSWYQKKFGNPDHKVTVGHTVGGEVAGDSAALFIYLAVKRFLTAPIDALTVGVKKTLNPFYTRLGHKSLKHWAEANQLEKNDPRYQHKLDMYKEFQAENLVDSSIIAASSTAVNVATQRVLGNKQRLDIILAGKLIGAFATMATMLGVRAAAPTAMLTLDEELSDRYFSKVARRMGSWLGVKPSHIVPVKPPEFLAEESFSMASLGDAPIVHRMPSNEKCSGFLARLHREYDDRDPNDPVAFAAFIEEQKQICDAFILALHPKGKFSKALSERYYTALSHLQAVDAPEGMAGKLLKKSARVGIQSIVVNRRDDQTGFKKLLGDAEFLNDLKQLIATEAAPKSKLLSLEKQEDLIESLVQTKGPLGREPAVHIYGHAKGQIIEHQALAEAYDLQGDATRVLAAELQKSLPGFDPAVVQEMAVDYMQDRKIAAEVVVRDLRLDGYIVNEAIRRSEAVRLQQTPETHVKKLAVHNASVDPIVQRFN